MNLHKKMILLIIYQSIAWSVSAAPIKLNGCYSFFKFKFGSYALEKEILTTNQSQPSTTSPQIQIPVFEKLNRDEIEALRSGNSSVHLKDLPDNYKKLMKMYTDQTVFYRRIYQEAPMNSSEEREAYQTYSKYLSLQEKLAKQQTEFKEVGYFDQPINALKTPLQFKIAFELLGKNNEKIVLNNWDEKAQVIAVARALGLPSSTKFLDRTVERIEVEIYSENRKIRESFKNNNKSLSEFKKTKSNYDSFTSSVKAFQRNHLNTVVRKANEIWNQNPEIQFSQILEKELQNSFAGLLLGLQQILKKYPEQETLIQDLSQEWRQLKFYSKWIEETARSPRERWYPDVRRLRHIALRTKDSQLISLLQIIDQKKMDIQNQSLTEAQKQWEKDKKQVFQSLLRESFKSQVEQQTKGFAAEISRRYRGLGNASKILLEDLINTQSESHLLWMSKQAPDLIGGEKFSSHQDAPHGVIAKEKFNLIHTLIKLGKNADRNELELTRKLLSSLDQDFLKTLKSQNFKVQVSRDNVTFGFSNLRGSRDPLNNLYDQSNSTLDSSKTLFLRTNFKDGKLTLDVAQFFTSLGKIVDQEIWRTENKKFNLNSEFAKAFASESRYLKAPHQNQDDFFSITFAMFCLDPDRFARSFPQTYLVFESQGARRFVSDRSQLLKIFKDMQKKPLFHFKPSALNLLFDLDKLNQVRRVSKKRPESLFIHLEGEPQESYLFAKDLALEHLYRRSPETVPYGYKDGFLKLDPAVFNNEKDLREALNGTLGMNGVVIYMDSVAGIPVTSPGFKILSDYFSRMNDFAILVVGGKKSDLKKISHKFPNLIEQEVKIPALSPEQLADVVIREALDEGYNFSQEARAALIAQSSSGPLESAEGIWKNIKNSQKKRVSLLTTEYQKQPHTVGYVLAQDVSSVKSSKPRPLDEINRMIGLGEVKEKIKAILSSVSLVRQQEALGVKSEKPMRQNLLFVGNPGTGKTTVADKLAESLFQEGFVKKRQVTKVKAPDLVSQNPEGAIKKLFEDNIDGVIFIDEFHQLKNTDNGKRAFEAMIPYLTDPEYANTVFIGAGYKEEIRELIQEVDKGGERRYTTVNFEDYNRNELKEIAIKMLKDRNLEATPEVVDELLEQVVIKQRTMKNPGNAGDVEKVLGASHERQRARLGEESQKRKLRPEDFTRLKPEDVHREPKLVVSEVWAEINQLKGLEEAKQKLQDIQNLVDFNKAMNRDTLTGVEPYIILDGPAGTGKTTLAALIGKLFAANGIVPDHGLVKGVGGDLVGGFVGNSTIVAVRKLFEAAWGKTLFIDEIGALAKAPGGYEDQAAKEILTQMENNRGKFILVVADYPENIDLFLKLDAGLPRRFGTRISLTPMPGKEAAHLLIGQLKQFDLEAQHLEKQIITEISRLASLPAWASGGDIRTLASKVMTYQASAFMQAHKQGIKIDPRKVIPEVLKRALEELETDINKRPKPRHSKEKREDVTYNFDYRKETKETEEAKREVASLSVEEKKTLEAISKVGHKFGHRFNDPNELLRQESDPNSEYNQAIAKELGTTTENALNMIKKAKAKAKVMVKVLRKELEQHFKYHCPYCKRIDSPACAYINEPLEWKIEHSLRKPWMEEKIVERMEEQEVEIDVNQ